MPVFGPIKRPDLIKYLRKCGFDGPYSGGKHPFMLKGDLTLTIPNPHLKDIGNRALKENSASSRHFTKRMGKNVDQLLWREGCFPGSIWLLRGFVRFPTR